MPKVLGGAAPAPSPAESPAPTRPAPAKHAADRHDVVLIYKPGRYEVLGDRVLPNLVHQPLEAGVGGVSLRRDGTHNFSGLREDTEAAGGIVLLPQTLYAAGWRKPADYLVTLAEWVDTDRFGDMKPTRDDVERLVARKADELAKMDAVQTNPNARNLGRDEVARQLAVAERTLAEMGDA